MFERASPRVYSIASGAHFLDTLATHLIRVADGNPMGLAEMRVLLPTRRAGRALAEAFLRQSEGRAMILPRVIPIGDVDEEELAITEAGLADAGGLDTDLPPTIPGLRRLALLARTIMAMPTHRFQPEQAIGLALELAKLLDRLVTEDRDPQSLRTLVKEDYAAHWHDVLQFLEILIDHWPRILAAEGSVDPAQRRNALLRQQAALWRRQRPSSPVIAAGSTGSIPATAELLSVVADLPCGAVVLPGLDQAMDEESWSALSPSHAQYGMRQLLMRLGVERQHVQDLTPETSSTSARAAFLSAALRPAEAPALPPLQSNDVEKALRTVRRVDCPGPREEANVIALIMRRTLETPAATCALITPDRALARRVAAALQRWHIDIDDSAGLPLAGTPPGSFLRLIADATTQNFAPVPLLALLKHPLAAGGMETADFRSLVRRLDKHVLRGPRPGPGLDGLSEAVAGNGVHKQLEPLLGILKDAIGPFAGLLRSDSAAAQDLLSSHVDAAQRLAATAETSGADRLWAGDAGDAAATLINEMDDAFAALDVLPTGAYAGVFERMMAGRVVRPRFGAHPRLFIWGLLEARLQHADVVVLGGLNEGTWPPAPETNPWMSRPMMQRIGLEMPERRTGLTAHDFQQAFSAPQVYLTRADRVAGTPTVPSRWLMRIDNLLKRAACPDALADRENDWLAWSDALDGTLHRPQPEPRPTPPLAARPNRLSATQIETLIRDPYAVYARHILKLPVLEPLDAEPSAADRGIIIHQALDDFIQMHPDQLPDDALARLLDVGRRAFAGHLARPGVRAFWWPRFERIADWFVAWQRDRQEAGWQVVLSERFGALRIDAVDGGFEIFAKPDRIDFRPDLGLAILDYKTGQPPSAKQVASGLSPQLPLEAAIAAAGGFENVPQDRMAQLIYVHLSGGRQAGSALPLKLDVSEVVEHTLSGVRRLIVKFADPATPYLSRPRPQFENRFGDYDHLARVGAWGLPGGDAE